MGIVVELAVRTNLSVFALDYRLTPENPFPAKLEDGLSAYEWLLNTGYQSKDILVFGSSAGGNLCLSLIQELRDTLRPLPCMAIALSPWTDINNSGDSIERNERYDILDRGMIQQGAEWLVGMDSPLNPKISPLLSDLHGLPPIYLQAGGKEIFIDTIRAYYARGQSQGVDIRLDVWESMNHMFQAYGNQLPEAVETMQRIADRVRRRRLS